MDAIYLKEFYLFASSRNQQTIINNIRLQVPSGATLDQKKISLIWKKHPTSVQGFFCIVNPMQVS